jgi:hypothetical protein
MAVSVQADERHFLAFCNEIFLPLQVMLSKTEQHRPIMEHYIHCKPPSGKISCPNRATLSGGKILACPKAVLFITNKTGIA